MTVCTCKSRANNNILFYKLIFPIFMVWQKYPRIAFTLRGTISLRGRRIAQTSTTAVIADCSLPLYLSQIRRDVPHQVSPMPLPRLFRAVIPLLSLSIAHSFSRWGFLTEGPNTIEVSTLSLPRGGCSRSSTPSRPSRLDLNSSSAFPFVLLPVVPFGISEPMAPGSWGWELLGWNEFDSDGSWARPPSGWGRRKALCSRWRSVWHRPCWFVDYPSFFVRVFRYGLQ